MGPSKFRFWVTGNFVMEGYNVVWTRPRKLYIYKQRFHIYR